MHRMLHKHWSTYFGFGIWGATGFMAQPTLASLAVHAGLVPLLIVVTIQLAKHEGRNWREYVDNKTADDAKDAANR